MYEVINIYLSAATEIVFRCVHSFDECFDFVRDDGLAPAMKISPAEGGVM